MKKKLLLLAYAFPPHTGGGVQRPLKFCKYLSKFNIEPIVLSASEIPGQKSDPLLLKEVTNIEVHRIQPFYVPRSSTNPFKKILNLTLKVVRTMSVSNFEWVFSSYFKAKEIIREGEVNVIMATGNPFGSFILGSLLSRHFNIPLVLDYRDSWSFSEYQWASGLIYRSFARFWERRVLKRAHHVIVVKPKMIDELRQLDSDIDKKVSLITNGYDEEDFHSLTDKSLNMSDDAFNIVFTGIMWHQAGHQSPLSFLQAFQRVIKSDPEKKVTFHIFGDVDPHYREMIQSFGLDGHIKLHGYVSHEEAVKAQAQADLLLLIIENEESREASAKYSGIIPGKIFEYLGSGSPVLTIAPEHSFEANLTLETGVGEWAACNDADAVYEKLSLMLKKDYQANRKEDLIKSYSRTNLTQKLSQVLEKLPSRK